MQDVPCEEEDEDDDGRRRTLEDQVDLETKY
jgi:hypothetical protein